MTPDTETLSDTIITAAEAPAQEAPPAPKKGKTKKTKSRSERAAAVGTALAASVTREVQVGGADWARLVIATKGALHDAHSADTASDKVKLADSPDFLSLVEDIKARGVLQSVLARTGTDTDTVVAGRKRVLAATAAHTALVEAGLPGLAPVPVRYLPEGTSDEVCADARLAENYQRSERSLAALRDDACELWERGCTDEQVAARLRLSKGMVADLRDYYSLPTKVQLAVDAGAVTLAVAVAVHKRMGEAGSRATHDEVERLITEAAQSGTVLTVESAESGTVVPPVLWASRSMVLGLLKVIEEQEPSPARTAALAVLHAVTDRSKVASAPGKVSRAARA
jgi:ParB-like chromosome segregation protein Spo0J